MNAKFLTEEGKTDVPEFCFNEYQTGDLPDNAATILCNWVKTKLLHSVK